MLDRIEKEIGNKPRSSVKGLILDNCRAGKIEGLEELTNLSDLSIVNAGLSSLEGFPELPHLKVLNLSDNRLSNGLSNINCPKLEKLKLSNNRIDNLETLEPLTQLKNLTTLDLFNCPVCEVDDYRSKVFKMFPSLTILDGTDIDGEEVDTSSDEEEEDESDEEKENESEEFSEDGGDEEVGLDYLKRDDLGDEEDDPTFETNGIQSSDADGNSSSDVSDEAAELSSKDDSCRKRNRSDAFPDENSCDEPTEKA